MFVEVIKGKKKLEVLNLSLILTVVAIVIKA